MTEPLSSNEHLLHLLRTTKRDMGYGWRVPKIQTDAADEIERQKKLIDEWEVMSLHDMAAKIERLRAALAGVLKHFEGDPHARDLEWITRAKALVKGTADETKARHPDGQCRAVLPPGPPIQCWKPDGHEGEHENGGWHWLPENETKGEPK